MRASPIHFADCLAVAAVSFMRYYYYRVWLRASGRRKTYTTRTEETPAVDRVGLPWYPRGVKNTAQKKRPLAALLLNVAQVVWHSRPASYAPRIGFSSPLRRGRYMMSTHPAFARIWAGAPYGGHFAAIAATYTERRFSQYGIVLVGGNSGPDN